MRKGHTIKFGDDRRSQASVTHLFDALMGKPLSPTCEKCGGITVDEGPRAGRCDCAPIAAVVEEHAQPVFIAHDWCGWNERFGRFTHVPTGDTLTCQQWMGQLDWDKAQLEWLAKYDGGLIVHKNYQSGPYRETGDTLGTVAEIIARLRDRENPKLSGAPAS